MNIRDVHTALDYLARLIQQDADRMKAEARGEPPAQLLAAAEQRAEEAEERARHAETKLAEATHRIGILDAIDEGRAHGARRIMNERDQAQQRAEQAERRAHGAEQALCALRGVTDTARAEEAEHRAEKAERRGDHWKAKAQEIEADRDHEAAAREQAQQDAERYKADHLAACRTIAEIHKAATGRTGMGPVRGVVEDVADVRARAEQAAERVKWATSAGEATAFILQRQINEQAAELDRARDRAEQAEAAITRVRDVADRWQRNGTANLARYAEIIRAAVAEPTTTEQQ